MPWFEEKDGDIVINLRIIPRAAKNAVQGLHGDALKIRLQAPPVEGKANQALVKFLSKHWKIPRADIEILSGETGRNKRIRIRNAPVSLRHNLESITD
ncbi:MAG: DUF167 family protein [Kiritimatiellales bacterium]|nr:DUF167 family protein [Kiritimatiellales bacterium]